MLVISICDPCVVYTFVTELSTDEGEQEDDRIIVSESVLNTLNATGDVFGNGPVIFEISVKLPAVPCSVFMSEGLHHKNKYVFATHCGVREFSAAEGTVKLPQKVIESIYAHLESESEDGVPQQRVSLDSLSLRIKYVRLPKITSVVFKPELNVGNNFGSILSLGPIKQCLEENLRKHLTLTAGDRVR
jgi:hypothetical protein